MFFRVLFRAAALFALLVSTFALNHFAFRSHAANPAAETKHGLTGSYYVANLGWENDVPPPPGSRPVYWSQVWVNNNDFKLRGLSQLRRQAAWIRRSPLGRAKVSATNLTALR